MLRAKRMSLGNQNDSNILLKNLDFFGKFGYWEDLQTSLLLHLVVNDDFSHWNQLGRLIDFAKKHTYCSETKNFNQFELGLIENVEIIQENIDFENIDFSKILDSDMDTSRQRKVYAFPNIRYEESTNIGIIINKSINPNCGTKVLRIFYLDTFYKTYFPSLGKRFTNAEDFLENYGIIADKIDEWYDGKEKIKIKVFTPMQSIAAGGAKILLDEYGCDSNQIYSRNPPKGCHEKDSTIGYRERLRNCSASLSEYMKRETNYKDQLSALKDGRTMATGKRRGRPPSAREPKTSPVANEPKTQPSGKRRGRPPSAKEPAKRRSVCKDKSIENCGQDNDGCKLSKTNRCYKVPDRRKKSSPL